jgi:hypothetical protein
MPLGIPGVSSVGSASVEITPDMSKFGQGLQSQVTGPLQRIGEVAAGVFAGILGARVLGRVVEGFKSIVTAGLGMNATLETSTLQFKTLMGDADLAKTHVAGLFEFAKKTPFETEPIITASRHLQTFGGTALNTKENLTLMGDAAAATGGNIDEVGFWAGRAYGAIQSGRPFGESAMRLQEMGILSGEARTRLEDLQKTGAEGPVVWAAFQEELQRFSGAMVEQAETWKGLTSTLMDVFKMTAGEVVQPLFDALKRMLAALIEFSNSPTFELIQEKATTIFRGVGMVIDKVTEAIKGMSGGLEGGIGPVGLLLGAFSPLGILLKLFAPIIVEVVRAFQPFLPLVLQLITMLLPPLVQIIRALMPIIAGLIPPIMQVVNAFLPLLPIVAQLIHALLPPLIQVLGIVANVIRFLAGPITFIAGLLGGILAGTIREIVGIIGSMVPVWERVIGVISRVIGWIRDIMGWFGRLGDAIGRIRLPAWLLGRSPSGLELSLRGIHGAMQTVVGDTLRARSAFAGLRAPDLGFAATGFGGAPGISTSHATIVVELDGETIARVIGEPLVREIRVKTGMRL